MSSDIPEGQPALADLFRESLPEYEVYLFDGPDAIVPAPAALQDAVNADAARKRQELLDRFGVDSPTIINAASEAAIASYFLGVTPDLAPICEVDPQADAEAIQQIFLSGFPDYLDAVFFAGTSDTAPSPGGCGLFDVVFLSDLRERDTEAMKSYIGRWRRPNSDTFDQYLELTSADLVAHEEAHMSRGNLEQHVILQEDPNSPYGYCISDADADHFFDETGLIPLGDELSPMEGGYYNASPLFEGIAAWHSANVVAPLRTFLGPHNGTNKNDPTGRFSIFTQTQAPPFPPRVKSYAYRDLYSGQAGQAVELLLEKIPETRAIIADFDAGTIDSRQFISDLLGVVPYEVLRIGQQEGTTAWADFYKAIQKL